MDGVGALGFLLPKLGSILADEYNLHKGTKDGIRYIRDELESMQIALEKVSEVPPNQLDKQVKLWARKVRIMSYQIEDTVDSYMVTVNPSAADDESESSTAICCVSDIRGMLPRNFKARRDIATEIERIRKEIKEVSKRHRDRYEVKDTIATPREHSDPRMRVLYQDATKLVGIDQSTKRIIELLSMQVDQGASMSDPRTMEKNPTLVSIVGPGGMGKTTLAKAVYAKLKDHFDCTAFVSVSLRPNIKSILSSILHQVNSTTKDVSKAKDKSIFHQDSHGNHGNTDNLKTDVITNIIGVLEDKRYLIIIDDIWDEKTWTDILECALVPNRLGSVIITTTRNTDIAKLCCDCNDVYGTIHHLGPLPDDESKKIFYTKVFGSDDGCPPELEDISAEILGKCKGLPLAIKTIAGLLANRNKQTKDEWVNIYKSIRTGLENTRGVTDMRSILSLSYCDMPSQLRPCFLYLSMFKEGRVIGRDDLIWRWIAEGFVNGKQDDDISRLYEVGDEYFNDLITRNMILPDQVDFLGRAQACIVHDLVLEFINFLSGEEDFVMVLSGQPFPFQRDNIHRLSLQNSKEKQGVPKAVKRLPHVRTLVVSSQAAATSMPSMSIFPVLRVLDLQCYTSPNIKNVGILLHLRYLKLSQENYGSHHIELPRGIGALQFLQILDLKDARIQGLPATLVHLKQLRVLKLSLNSWDKRYEERLIQCLCNLKKLEALYIFAGTNVSTLDFMFSLVSHHVELPQGIGPFKYLQILDLKDATIQGMPATLVQLRRLRVLKLSLYSRNKRYEELLIQCLCNLENLETLYISVAANVSLNFMSTVQWATPYLRIFTTRFHEQNEHILRPGSVWRELSSFSTLCWMIDYSLSNLSDLSITVRKLQQQDVEILAQFPNLVTLDLEVIEACEEGRLVISGHERAFHRLSNLKFASRAMGLLFTPGAMQHLHELYLCFSIAHTKDVHDLKDIDFHFGLQNLTSLKAVEVEVDCRCAWHRESRAVEAALLTAANSNQNQPTFVLRKYFEREMMSEAVFSEQEGSSRGMAEEKPDGLSRIGPYGGNGGCSCNIQVSPHHLDTVTLKSGNSVDSLAFSYRDHNGQQCNAGPWGGSGGVDSTFYLGPEEYLKQVSGTTNSFWGINNVVTSLTFVTNVKSYGPYGKDDGQNQFIVKARRNNCIVGFFGHSGILLDSIGFYTRPL